MTFAGRLYRPRVLAAVFGAYLGLVMLASWYFASTLDNPWYGPDLTRWVYTAYILVAAVFLAGVGALAVQIQNSFEARVREVNRQLGSLLWEAGTPFPVGDGREDSEGPAADPERGDPEERILNEVLETMGEAQTQEGQQLLLESAPAVEDEDTAVEMAREAMLQRELMRRRDGLKLHQGFLARFLPGPTAVAVGFLGVSAAMLPASEGMLQTMHRWNTTLILGFAYGWVGLAAYFAVSILGVVTSLRTERKKRAE